MISRCLISNQKPVRICGWQPFQLVYCEETRGIIPNLMFLFLLASKIDLFWQDFQAELAVTKARMHARVCVCVCNVRSNIKLFIYDIHFVGRTKKYTNYFLVLTHFSLFVSFISAAPNMDDGVSATHWLLQSIYPQNSSSSSGGGGGGGGGKMVNERRMQRPRLSLIIRQMVFLLLLILYFSFFLGFISSFNRSS